ncbi:HAD hydrolase family protein [Sphingobacterium daejeonense]|uniref:HAD hydrolase family protein n=1 Tax=Sphingobacterium daejeonense TaxID=371142 RepID=UPI0021A66D2B|nr:HAD hydrolase family protein [Sphingobacterium daejeonense]MCT1531975.1 HAD hydrolase family protein [Sphingobacterium daejeonense]
MGKPFSKELEKISNTLKWSFEQSTDSLRKAILDDKKPLVIIGSGGSLSACHFLVLLYQQYGVIAKAITPLDLHYSQQILRESNILFVSASGKNNDILFSYKTAVNCEPHRLLSICMKPKSPLEKLSERVSTSFHFSYNLPTGSDGFLATNSLVAFFGLLAKALHLKQDLIFESKTDENINHFKNLTREFFNKVTPDFTFLVLHAGWCQPIAVDLESKLAEAALGDVLISDYRNFGHGRHHWLDKRGVKSCIVALVTPDEKEIAIKTFKLLPTETPILFIETDKTGPEGSIDLLIKSFVFVEALGQSQGIDPGKPGVPGYGRQLYHLNYQSIYLKSEKKSEKQKRVSIIRKSKASVFNDLSNEEQIYWTSSYDKFTSTLQKATFGSVILDYDGTICSAKNRFGDMDYEVIPYLTTLLSNGFVLGIATGRGKSVKKALRDAIPAKFWPQIIIGYYNCSEVGLLDDNSTPNKELQINKGLKDIHELLVSYNFPVEITFELKPSQLTIQIKEPEKWKKVRDSIIQLIMLKNPENIQILESSHSMDIIDHSVTNKLNIKSYCQKAAENLGKENDCLFIGDKGQWPGNDYQLLSEPHSLSVDDVSPLNESCWNIAAPSIKNVDATIYYLSCLEYKPNHIKFKLK